VANAVAKEITDKFKSLSLNEAREAMHALKLVFHDIEWSNKSEHRKNALEKIQGART
jgi:hypothetical protein